MTNYAKKSLEGLWVGDCVGNLGQLYFALDILKALSEGVSKYGGQLAQFHNQFMYSDDTEEAIVLYNHLRDSLADVVSESFKLRGDQFTFLSVREAFKSKPFVNQDKLAKGFATRYMERDPDGEIFGYGLNTRKVLRDIYEGVPWSDANKIIKKSEGMPSHIDSLVHSLSTGENIKQAMSAVNRSLNSQRAEQLGKVKEGSCGNGSAMRVAPLGAFLAQFWYADEENWSEGPMLCDYEKRVIAESALQAEVTHCHPEGINGSIAIATLAHNVAEMMSWPHWDHIREILYQNLLRRVPSGQVRDGIVRAMNLPLDLPVGKVIEVLGNGSNVTCQDTVPFCCYEAIKWISQLKHDPEMYEKAIIETSMAFGDVDTNCAIVGGIVGIVCPPPTKWSQFCKPMEGVEEVYTPRFNLQNMVEDVNIPIRSTNV